MSTTLNISSSTEALLGYSHFELLSKNPFDLIHPDDLESVKSAFIESLLKPSNPVKTEYRFKKANGEYIQMETIGINFPCEPGEKSITINPGKPLNQNDYSVKLRKSLCEKETALQETHSRVKNTLQLILSLLKLQADYTSDLTIKNCVMMDYSRIKAISLICQLLHRSADQKHINIEEYLYDLATNLLATYDDHRENVSIKISTSNIYFNAETAVPFGLIINEMITASMNRGTRYNSPRGIKIKLTKNIDDSYRLEYTDSGKGLPTIGSGDHFSAFGIHLINLLVKRLDGVIDVITAGSKIYKIGFRGINNQTKLQNAGY